MYIEEDIISLIMLTIFTVGPFVIIAYFSILFTLISPVVFIFYLIKHSFLIRLVKKIAKSMKINKTYYNKSYFNIIFIEHLIYKGIIENKEIIINVDSKKIKNSLEITIMQKTKLNHNFIFKCSEKIPLFVDNLIFQELDKKKSIIIRLSNNKIMDKIKNIIDNDTQLVIDDKKIFIKKENLKNQIIIKKTLKIFTNKLKNLLFITNALNEKIDDEVLMINNIEHENDLELRIINFSILVIFHKDKYKELLENLKKDQNIIISSMAQIGLNEKISENIKQILVSENKKAINFVLYYLENIYNNEDNSELLLSVLKITKYPEIIFHITRLLLNKNNKYIIKKTFTELNKKNKLLDKEKSFKIYIINFCGNNKIHESIIWLGKQLKKRDNEIITVVINSFIKIGNVNAVEFLLPLTEGVYSDSIKNSAKKAIFLLQKDISNKNYGDLTLAEFETEGKLSIDEKRNIGELSFEE